MANMNSLNCALNQLAAKLKTTTAGLYMMDSLTKCIVFLSLWWSRLPNTMAQNLSVPLAFVALLHLANEKVSIVFFKPYILKIIWRYQCVVMCTVVLFSLHVAIFIFRLQTTWKVHIMLFHMLWWWVSMLTPKSNKNQNLVSATIFQQLPESFSGPPNILNCPTYERRQSKKWPWFWVRTPTEYIVKPTQSHIASAHRSSRPTSSSTSTSWPVRAEWAWSGQGLKRQ